MAQDLLGRQTGVQNWLSRDTFTYDTLARLQSLNTPNHPSGLPLTYLYDANSNLVQFQTWLGTFTYTYDPRDLQTVVADPGFASPSVQGGFNTTTYDARHLPIHQVHPDGSTTTRTYDALQRATNQVFYQKNSTQFANNLLSYDAVGRPLTRNQAVGLFTYSYDLVDQLVSEANKQQGLVT